MKSVSIKILNQPFSVQVSEEQEEHLQRLVAFFDGRVRDLHTRNKSDFSTLLVLAALGIVDELSDERDKTARYANRIKDLEFRVDNPASLTVERGTLQRLEAVTKAFEGLEKKLKTE